MPGLQRLFGCSVEYAKLLPLLNLDSFVVFGADVANILEDFGSVEDPLQY
jgi:hypothetical protein